MESDLKSDCGPGCQLLQMTNSLSFLPRFHIHDEHTPKDDEYVKKTTEKLYTPLVAQQYRILKILPGQKHWPLKSRLLRATLTPVNGARLDEEIDRDSLVEYDALSYCWGVQARTCSVTCNDVEVPITSHLRNALHSFRRDDHASYVWTDALCINQLGDIKEKGEQVQLMFTIFQKARRVIGWLGSSKEKCEYEDLFFKCLHLSSARSLSEASNSVQLNQLYSKDDDPTCDCVLICLKSYALQFVQRDPWFRRTWIRQEILAAKKVEMRYGSYSFDLQYLIRLIALIDSDHCRPSLQIFHKLVEKHDARALSRSRVHRIARTRVAKWLEAVLSNSQGFEAEVKQDLIFALQNIAQPEDTGLQLLLPTIDYNMPTSELFEQFVKRLMYLDGSPKLAAFDIFEDRTDFQSACLPTWVPDWRKVKTRLARADLDHYIPHGYDIDTSRPGLLSIDGVLLGTVTECWPLHDYQTLLSASLGKSNRSFAFASYNVYRSPTSSLSCYAPFNDMPMIVRSLEEIAYRPYRYTIEGLTLVDDLRQPYVLASVIVQPGDLLVSFAWDTALLTTYGYVQKTWCSALRRFSGGPDRYLFLGRCVFDHLGPRESEKAHYRKAPTSIRRYTLI